MSLTLRASRALLLVPVLLLAACATTRGTMTLALPADAGSQAASGNKVAVIETVQDERVFETAPRDPSIPSLKKGADYALDAEGRKAAIARKRNGYGKAMGDIVLEGGQTVETITRDLVQRGLQQQGYRVVDAAGAPADALRVGVVIEQFWAWLTPGFWSIQMEAKLHTRLRVSGVADDIQVAAYGLNKGQTGREDNWRVAYERAFADYLVKQAAALEGAGIR
jgi:uncharacterized lipoprotein YajG